MVLAFGSGGFGDEAGEEAEKSNESPPKWSEQGLWAFGNAFLLPKAVKREKFSAQHFLRICH